jgi:hypothetical protein
MHSSLFRQAVTDYSLPKGVSVFGGNCASRLGAESNPMHQSPTRLLPIAEADSYGESVELPSPDSRLRLSLSTAPY